MPQYLVMRDLAGWDEDELYACILRAKLCLPRYEGLRWLLSYYDRDLGQTVCHVEAPDEETVREHARLSGLPITSVQTVAVLDPASFVVTRAAREDIPLLEAVLGAR